jgi:hypothetical protein
MDQVLHRKKLFGGKFTAEEFHAKYAFRPGIKCSGCGGRPMVRAITMMELKEARRVNPAIDELMTIAPEGLLEQIVQIKGSDGRPIPYLRLGVAHACKACSPSMEKQLAKAPSHVIVEINRGPGTDKIIG